MGVDGRHLTILADLAVAACSGLRARPGADRVPGGPAALARVAALLLAGLSAGALAETHRLPLLPSASDALREGVVRILNHSGEAGQVAVTAIDDSGAAFGPVALALAARHAVEFTSTDLERGNAGKGIPTGIGGGAGDWRLVLETELAIEPLVYVRTPGASPADSAPACRAGPSTTASRCPRRAPNSPTAAGCG